MKTIFKIVPAVCLISCSSVQYEASNAKTGNYERLSMVNVTGSESVETAGGMRFTGNRVKNSGQLIQALVTWAAGWLHLGTVKNDNALVAKQGEQAVAAQQIAAQKEIELAKIAAEAAKAKP